MKYHPPYHLRINKAVDRWIFIDAIRRLLVGDPNSYTYFGFGGPFLNDFRLMHSAFPKMKLVSIESDEDTYLRQKFHKFTSNISFKHSEISDFIAEYESNGKEIFWLDYTSLEVDRFNEFDSLLNLIGNDCIIRITLPLYKGRKEKSYPKFQKKFETLLPADSKNKFLHDFAKLVLEMLIISAHRILPESSGKTFFPVSSIKYSDSERGQVLTLTGVVTSPDDNIINYRSNIEGWEFASKDWSDIRLIDLPFLSVKERLVLNPELPKSSVDWFKKCLQYSLGETEDESNKKFEQYAQYYRFYPQFVEMIS